MMEQGPKSRLRLPFSFFVGTELFLEKPDLWPACRRMEVKERGVLIMKKHSNREGNIHVT